MPLLKLDFIRRESTGPRTFGSVGEFIGQEASGNGVTLIRLGGVDAGRAPEFVSHAGDDDEKAP